MKDVGCPRGDKCTFKHPPRTGKCLRCGAIAQRRRPQRDQQKGSSSTSTSTPTTTSKARAKSKGAPKARSKPQKQEQGNKVWMKSTVQIEEVPERAEPAIEPLATHSFTMAANAFRPTNHNVAAGASEDTPDKTPILDTGATKRLLYLERLSDENIENAKRIYLGVANGTQAKALLYNNIMYARSTSQTFGRRRPAQGAAGFATCVE